MKKIIFLFLIFSMFTQAHILKIGHRGACGYEPENTLRSFAKAIELGVDVIELDVHVCATGELVVLHAYYLHETTNGVGLLAEKTFEELRQLDAGKGEKIPTLEEVFDLVDRRVIVNIELKGEGTAQPIAELIKKYVSQKGWVYDDFMVSCFDHYRVREFHELLPEVVTGAVLEGTPIGYAEFAEKAGAQVVVLCIDSINQAIVDDAHARGMKVFVYTINEPEDIDQMRALGVDGLISNYPDRL